MSEERTSHRSNKHSSSKKGKHFAVIPYIAIPLLFCVIAVILAFPFGRIAMGYAIKTVHKAQSVLVMDYNDLKSDSEINYDNTDVENLNLVVGQKIGTVSCDNAGVKTDLYYAINRVSLRNGAALMAKGGLPDGDKPVKIYGYISTAFKGLDNVKKGDIIRIETSWGEFYYKVNSTEIGKKSADNGSDLILSTSYSDAPFASYESKRLYVYATLTDGEVA